MKKIIFLTVAAVLAASCSGFLDRYPYDEVSSKTVYSSARMTEAAVIGVYSNVRYDFVNTDNITWDAYSSVLDPNTLINYSDYAMLMGTVRPSAGVFLNRWKRLYETVNRANDVISNIAQVPDMSDGLKSCRLSECKFLRAWSYYQLNCLWRGVPIYLENLAPSQYMKARSSEEDVWEMIVTELGDCIADENFPMKYAKNSADKGRVTKAAAYFLRAKVYMWQKKWSLAEADLRSIGPGGYSLFTGSYADLFKQANEKCDEMVFSLNMTEDAGNGNVYPYMYGNIRTAGGGWNRYFLNTAFCDSYQWADGRPFSFDDVIPGYSSMGAKERSVYFYRDNMTESEIRERTEYGARMSEYLPVGNEARIKAAYIGRDPRLDATVITPYEAYHGGTPADASYTCRYPYRAMDDSDLKTQFNQYCIYCIQKFVTEGREYMNPSYNPVDVPIFRYADVLLCLAECLVEQGSAGMDEAVVLVNQVRSRAGLAPLNDGNAWNAVGSREDMLKRIRQEKHWELACENQLYFEELRWGNWKEDKYEKAGGLTQMWGDRVYDYKWDEAYRAWAIPSTECEKNKNLKQNENWL